ncbi:MAG: alpha/beta fold hydrolase [Actinomycetota bacterium]
MTTTDLTLTDRESTRIAAINESGRQPVVLVHGLWLLAGSWSRWEHFLTERGYAPLALDWPGEPRTVEAARSDPELLAGTGIQQVADRAEAAIEGLTRQPAVIGHSVGGLVAQILAGRGLNRATVAVDPAPFKGIRGLPWSVVKSSFPVLKSPGNRRKAITLTLDQFTYGFANAVSADEAEALYEEFHAAAPGRPVFEIGFANFTPSAASSVDTTSADRGPLAIVSGGADHTVPPSLAKAAYRKQSKNQALTELITIDGAGHSLVIDHRWQEVAAATVDFLERKGLSPDRHADQQLS